MKETSYRHYLLIVLMVLLAFNYVDRLALGLVLQDIKVDFHVSDTQLGFLSGMAFALFYSVMGIPIARWADRGNRVMIISVTATLWSAMVALCGLTSNFMQLLLARIGVAVGEAGCMPPANSLIPDYFTRAERPRAVGIYQLGTGLSNVVGYFLAGWLNEVYGWRVMFVVLGIPGLALAALAWFTLREPRLGKPTINARGRLAATNGVVPETASLSLTQSSLKEVCVNLWANVTFRHVLFCFSVISFFGYGIAQWLPAFFIRSFGLKTGELGTWFAVIYGLAGMVGMYLGGAWASRRAPNNERLQLKVLAFVVSCFGIISACAYLSPSPYLAFGLLGMGYVAFAMAYGPLFASVQTLVPEHMRSTSIALIYFFANLIGLGLGPWAAGALSDALRPLVGEESLRYALLALCPGYLWAGWHLFRASQTITRDLDAAQTEAV
jgi:MFS family permease